MTNPAGAFITPRRMAAASPLPMFFRDIVPVDPVRHAGLRLDRGRDYRFARQTNAIPLALSEFAAAAADYPIVFGAPGRTSGLAIVGCRDQENLFIDPDQAWRPGAYIPAYVRNYPFAVIEAPGSETAMLGVDPLASSLGASGAAMFEGHAPAPALKEAMNLCTALHHALKQTVVFCAALEREGLLKDYKAVIEFAHGGQMTLGGFRVIDAAKFDALPDERFLEWRRNGWLAPIFAHFQSTARWSRIVDLAAVGAR